jgi:hypothetical protein
METKHTFIMSSIYSWSTKNHVDITYEMFFVENIDWYFRYLRRDTLAMLLSLSNVNHDSNIAIVESCQGLILASVIQRCASGNGLIFNLTPAGEQNSTS